MLIGTYPRNIATVILQWNPSVHCPQNSEFIKNRRKCSFFFSRDFFLQWNLQLSLCLGGSWKRSTIRIMNRIHGQRNSARERTWGGCWEKLVLEEIAKHDDIFIPWRTVSWSLKDGMKASFNGGHCHPHCGYLRTIIGDRGPRSLVTISRSMNTSLLFLLPPAPFLLLYTFICCTLHDTKEINNFIYISHSNRLTVFIFLISLIPDFSICIDILPELVTAHAYLHFMNIFQSCHA